MVFVVSVVSRGGVAGTVLSGGNAGVEQLDKKKPTIISRANHHRAPSREPLTDRVTKRPPWVGIYGDTHYSDIRIHLADSFGTEIDAAREKSPYISYSKGSVKKRGLRGIFYLRVTWQKR